MKLIFLSPLAFMFSLQVYAVSFDCSKEVDEAIKKCDESATTAFMTNNANARNAQRTIAGANGLMENAGAMQSQVSMQGMRNVDGATTECKEQKRKMRGQCADAAREANAKNQSGTVEEIKENLKQGERYIDNRIGHLDSEMANLAGNGVAGGNGVVGASSAEQPK